jgi:hypothetical protein
MGSLQKQGIHHHEKETDYKRIDNVVTSNCEK